MSASTRSCALFVVLLFVLPAGDARAVCLSPGGNVCQSSTQCTFQGLTNTAVGNAQLSIDPQWRLQISNIGTTGLDGVRVDNPSNFERAHEEWIELGVIGWEQPEVSSTLAGSFIRAESTAVLSNSAGADRSIVLLIDEMPNDTIRIVPDFSNAGATTVRYEVYNAQGALVGQSAVPTSAAATTTSWPVKQGFSFVRWPGTVPITIPGGGPVLNGVELRILPQTGTTVTVTRNMLLTIKRVTASLGPLATFTVNEERFTDATSCLAMPAFTGGGRRILIVVLLAAFMLALLRRRAL